MPKESTQPRRSRPQIEGYGIPETEEGMLSWSFVTERVGSPRNYWIATVRPDGRPHAVPSWGVWLDGVFYFGGGEKTRHLRNVRSNPNVVMHLESGDEVVIFEGVAEEITGRDLRARIDDAYEAKYGIRHGTPVFALRPQVVFAWAEYPVSATRFRFDQA